MVRCPNHMCERFDPVYKDELAAHDMRAGPQPSAKPQASAPPPRGSFEPDEQFRLEIDYTNHQGEHKSFVGDARTLNLPVHAWRVEDLAAARRLIAAGVGGIMTDRPDRVLALLGRGPGG